MHAGSSGVVNKCWCSSETSIVRGCITNWTTDCSIRVYRSFQQRADHSQQLLPQPQVHNHLIHALNHCYNIMPKNDLKF